MDYTETAALMTDPAFRSRVKVACIHFADYIVNEPPSTTAHTTRYRWAQGTFTNPDSSAATVMPPLVMDPTVQAQGAAISDADLQTAVENAVNKMI